MFIAYEFKMHVSANRYHDAHCVCMAMNKCFSGAAPINSKRVDGPIGLVAFLKIRHPFIGT